MARARYDESMIKRLSPLVLLALILIFPAGKGAPGKETIRVWLRIFAKRHRLELKNESGLYVNGMDRPVRRIIIERDYDRLVCCSREFRSISVRPARSSMTSIVTRYGTKKYDGHFTVSVKNNAFEVINTTSLDSHLMGVVGSELGESFHMETLKAQAVSSRSYFHAVRGERENGRYHISDLAGLSQSFRGLQYAGRRVKRAVWATRGEVLYRGNKMYLPYYHSTCGGMLLSSGESWGNSAIELSSLTRRFDGSQKKPHCRISPYYTWKLKIKKKRVFDALEKRLNPGGGISRIIFKFKKHQVLARTVLVIGDNYRLPLRGAKFKSLLEREGISGMRSIRCSIKESGGYYEISGRGFGHLVGLCQWGAEFMARKGASYREILRYYYPGISISRKFK
jgi:stage II sporulation protein D